MKPSRPWPTLGVIPALMYGLIVLPFILYWSELPDSLGTHWGLTGNADRSMSRLVALLVIGSILAAVHLAVTRVVAQTPHEAPSSTL